MIEGWVGRPGSGKSLALTRRVLREVERRPKRPVWTTTPMVIPGRELVYLTKTDQAVRWVRDPGSPYEFSATVHADPALLRYATDNASTVVVVMTHWSHLLAAPRGALQVWDEAHAWFDSRDALALVAEMRGQLSQTRHALWDVFWTTQHISQIDKRLRNITNWVRVMNAWGHTKETVDKASGELLVESHPRIFSWSMYDPADIGKAKAKAAARGYFRFPRKAADAYDTHFTVEAATYQASPAARRPRAVPA